MNVSIWLPTLAGLARAEPIWANNTYSNTGANPTNTDYTVPDHRAALILQFAMYQFGGTAYSHHRLAHSRPGVGTVVVKSVAGVGSFETTEAPTAMFLQPGDTLLSLPRGGAADSDYAAGFSGIEFDWDEAA